ncbi:MAG: Crp/Fnr family transcriptional regulator [Armatimonadota bacterium]|nr:Crp/Fnr family transcriptional regulator [Armatimonadota bacterium]MDR7436244.1 Crp/Fnr family transcriptional regulator [Armatimonadota bacterium]MDR7471376.1 Crp/Fnr family transcriptional regulator [Armatimonadota bacterium]MDR7506412.1 Crp/Fnr family transcriptional regulator [Armatimonadota bacterium]MDR7508967.1 Crp/Fnr family transcriptional regulator [Armatimonadota bacterium]
MAVTASRRPDKIWYLRQVDLFAGVDEAELRRLGERATLREFGRGSVILHPDEPQERVYVIKEGRVKISRYSPDGREQILALLGPGDIFGELALVGEAEPVHAEAFEHTLLCALSRDDMAALLRRHPELMLHVLRTLADRLRVAEEEIADLVFRTVPGRLAALLLRLAEASGHRHGGRLRLALRLTHQDIASMIGATRETVTATLSRLRAAGLIATEGRRIVVLDPEGLRRLSANTR